MDNKTLSTRYTGKIKTGSQRTKKEYDIPNPKLPVSVDVEKKPRKSKNPTQSNLSLHRWNDEHLSKWWSEKDIPLSISQNQAEIPNWIKESSKKKPVSKSNPREESKAGESKLQWRKVSKKSQRSFSKNKERVYLLSKQESEKNLESPRGPFSKTFDKKSYTESSEQWSSWDTKPRKQSTGFEKSKTGYKGIWNPWNNSWIPKKSTRNWDDDSKHISNSPKEKLEKSYPEGKNAQNQSKKETNKKTKYITPKPSWEKEIDSRDNKKIKDPTK